MAILFSCTPQFVFAQTGETGQSVLSVKNDFIGHWKSNKDPNEFIDIYKDGSLTIVQRGSAIKNNKDRNRFIATYERGNRISVDLGYGLSPLTLSGDGTKISFLGIEYSKK